MAVLRYKKLSEEEDGYLLLESLLTLIILMAVSISLCPLAVSWLEKHQESKNSLEECRQLYESSIILNNEQAKQPEDDRNIIQSDKYGIRIKDSRAEVVIYESIFKK